jgi:hypothetical protein
MIRILTHHLSFLSVFLLILALPAQAKSEWYKATSDHFVVYSEGTTDGVRAYIQKLENFDAVLSVTTGRISEPAANKLLVFVVPSISAVQRQMGGNASNIAGFYRARMWGTIAVVPRRTGGSGEYDLDAETVLFHEYVHHFMLQNAPSAYPPWYVEGFAEYFSTTDFRTDGSIYVGYPAKHRFYGIAALPQFPVARLLIPDERPMSADQRESFYGWSWLLTHYLRYAPDRSGQLLNYLKAYASGAAPTVAADAFGPMAKLQTDLVKYRSQRRLSYIQMRGVQLPTKTIDVIPLSESEGASIPLFLRSMRESTSASEVKSAVAEARQLASRYPKEPMAQDVLAEFELDAEQFDAARAANAAVIVAKPSNSRALLRSARIEIEQMKAKGDEVQWKAVRSLIIKANRAAPDDPFPLWMFYKWHELSGNAAPKIAIDGLRRGLELAPQVPEFRFAYASRLVRDGKRDDARRVLAPLINDPHSPEIRDAAAKLLASAGSDTVMPDDKALAKIHTSSRH